MDLASHQRIMALDLGERRIGIAVSDPLLLTAQGVTTIKGTAHPDWIEELVPLVEQFEVGAFVVGLPRHMSGEIGEKGEQAERVADLLRQRFEQPVHLWDERLSTSAVERTLVTADLSRQKRKRVIDKLAASWFLQGFLDAQRR